MTNSTLYLTLDNSDTHSLSDESNHEVESLEEAAEIAKTYDCDGTVRDEPGFVKGYVKADGTWSAS